MSTPDTSPSSQEALEAQISELVLLRASLPQGGFRWVPAARSRDEGDEGEEALWERLVVAAENFEPSPLHAETGAGHWDALTPFRFLVAVSAEVSLERLSTGRSLPGVWLDVQLPRGYGSRSESASVLSPEEGRDPVILTKGDGLDRTTQASIAALVLARVEANREEDHRVYDVLIHLQDHIARHPSSHFPTGRTDNISGQTAGNKSANNEDEDGRKTTFDFLRVIIWSHHIKATGKRKDLIAWAAELDCWGVVKPGYPGIIVLDGLSSDIDEFVRRIKVRYPRLCALCTLYAIHSHPAAHSDTSQLLPSPPETLLRERAIASPTLAGKRGKAALAECGRVGGGKAKVRPGVEEVETMSELSERLRSVGLEEEFLDAVRIHKAK